MNVDSTVTTLAELLTTPATGRVRLEQLSAQTGEKRPQATVTVGFPFEAGVDDQQVTVTGGEYADGEITVDIAVTFDDTTGASGTDSGDVDADPTDDAQPAYKDPDRLREVYAEYDSFTEMTEALGVDVTAQTVRRNMMKEGIHTPETTDSTATDEDAEATETAQSDRDRTETGRAEADDAVADGVGEVTPADEEFSDVDLPEGISPADVSEAVTNSSSLHGVQMALDIEIAEARSLLQELGVLQYVSGRLSDRDVDPDPVEIEEQIQDSLRARADGSGQGS